MKFKPHFELQGRHAYLSASKPHWVNYDDGKIRHTFNNHMEAQRGSDMHELAKMAIKLGRKMPRNKETFNQYVNDAIGFRMVPEQVLCYSEIAFGTADTISFRPDPEVEGLMVLRIHDLKNGLNAASFAQLKIYSAFFCLEYEVDPSTIRIVLRIYQNNEVKELEPSAEEIQRIMDKTVYTEKLVRELKEAMYA